MASKAQSQPSLPGLVLIPNPPARTHPPTHPTEQTSSEMASSPSGAWTVQLGFGNTISLDVGIALNEIMHPSKIGIYNVFTHVNYNYSENPSLMIFNKLQYVISMSLKFFPRDCFGLPSPMLPSLP